MRKKTCWIILLAAGLGLGGRAAEPAVKTLVIEQPMCAGMSGFRAHWDKPIPVAEDGARLRKDTVVTNRGETAVWDGVKPGPLAFDAVHRSLLVRFPNAGQVIADALADGWALDKAELVLPYLDEEVWPQGGVDFARPDGYRYRTNWDCDKMYRSLRPNWHAVASLLRKPWLADPVDGPTYNAAIPGAVYWKRFGASDTAEDRFPASFGPAEVSSYNPTGRLDVTSFLTDEAYGKTAADRIRAVADCGFVISKLEVYDARYFQGAYEWAISTGPRAILVKSPSLVLSLSKGKPMAKVAIEPVDVRALQAKFKDKPAGAPTAVVPTPEEVAKLNERFMTRPAWMPEWQYAHVKQLMALKTGTVEPFYYRVTPQHVINDVRNRAQQKMKKEKVEVNVDYEVYLCWLDWIHGRPPRFWEGHLTAANNIMEWYNFRDALPEPVKESIIRCWTAWLMPDRETAMTDKQRRNFADLTGALIHPMADDPRVGLDDAGKVAEWNQGDTYYRKTGDWRGNKSYYRSGFTRMMSTANFNSSSASGALLNGQIIGSERAMADGRAGLMTFPFWMWTYNAGVGQEYIDHYYWAIATAGNKLFGDFCEKPEDRMAGWSIITKTIEELSGGYHPNLMKLMGPASRTVNEQVLGQQDGLTHILHVLSPSGALTDTATGALPALSANTNKPASAWGHDFPPESVALQSLSGPWGDPWIAELIDEKPLPWSGLFEKKVVSEGDWVSTYFGVNYGLVSIRRTPQRIHVLGHWRRKAERPSTMRDIGTLDMRVGYNRTQIANDGAGVISDQGFYRCYQDGNKLIMLARPNTNWFAQLLTPKKEGQAIPAIESIQTTAALFNYEEAGPGWTVAVDGKPVEALPLAVKQGQVVTVKDGVSYLAIRPLPATDLGRGVAFNLEAGEAQPQAYHAEILIKPALVINAFFYQKGTPFSAADLARLGQARGGFVLEMGDEAEYGSFEKFQAHIREAVLSGGSSAGGEYAVSYESGKDTLVARWSDEVTQGSPDFTVNGADPYPAKEQGLWRDTTLTRMGKGRLEKNGALIERKGGEGDVMLLQTFPKQTIYVAMNPLPTYQGFTFTVPGGVRVEPNGLFSMGRIAVKDSREFDIRYQAFEKNAPPPEARATKLFIGGTRVKPVVILNQKDVSGSVKAVTQDGAGGWEVPLP